MSLFSSRYAKKASSKAATESLPKGKAKITILPSGIIELTTPYKNAEFLKEFNAICKRRVFLEDRKLWQVHSQYISELVDITLRHFGEIEGLDKIYANPYDTLCVQPTMPSEIIASVVKAYRVIYAPDRAPEHLKQAYTSKLQEIAEAYESIKKERNTNGG